MIWRPHAEHVFRLSAGTSFRFPTITESELLVAQQLFLSNSTNLPFRFVELSLLGNKNLRSEQMRMMEVAYTVQKSAVQFMSAAYVYRLKNVIATTLPEIELTFPAPSVRVSFENRLGTIRAWGGEVGMKVLFKPGLDGAVNYAYQNIKDVVDPLSPSDGGPKHKVNIGLRFQKRGWVISGWMHWVSKTLWFQNNLIPDADAVGQVDAYTLINGQMRYVFSGVLKKWTIGLRVFNLLNNRHFETLPSSNMGQGQRGELIQRRLVGTLTFSF